MQDIGPGGWIDKTDAANKATCKYDERGLVATVEGPTYRCPGPKDILGDTAITVEVSLLNPDTCAGIWFRFRDSLGGYALQVCPDGAYFVQHHKDAKGHWTLTPLRSLRFAQPIPLREANRFTVTAKGTAMAFYRGDDSLFTWSDGLFDHGRICIGVLQREAAKGVAYSAAIRYVEVWGAPAPAVPISSATSAGTA